jgi:hypothetical protein
MSATATEAPLPGVDGYLADLAAVREELDAGYHRLADLVAGITNETDSEGR